jgi:hypothetical protein
MTSETRQRLRDALALFALGAVFAVLLYGVWLAAPLLR